MTEQYIPVSIGATACVLAVLLISLRASTQIARAVGVFVERWISARNSTASLVVIALACVAVASFGASGAFDQRRVGADVLSPNIAATDAEGLAPLRAYAGKIDSERNSRLSGPTAAKPAEVTDVDTMIAKLAARLEKEPDDVKGWKMLGWSYLNLDRPEEAIKAYETALKLEPGDAAITTALERARSARTGGSRSPSADKATIEVADAALAAAETRSVTAHDSMIRGMVDQLAARLEVAPSDEAGWLQLIRSRVTLDDRDAAKAALAKALNAFASDAAAKARVTAVAAELGVTTD